MSKDRIEEMKETVEALNCLLDFIKKDDIPDNVRKGVLQDMNDVLEGRSEVVTINDGFQIMTRKEYKYNPSTRRPYPKRG